MIVSPQIFRFIQACVSVQEIYHWSLCAMNCRWYNYLIPFERVGKRLCLLVAIVVHMAMCGRLGHEISRLSSFGQRYTFCAIFDGPVQPLVQFDLSDIAREVTRSPSCRVASASSSISLSLSRLSTSLDTISPVGQVGLQTGISGKLFEGSRKSGLRGANMTWGRN